MTMVVKGILIDLGDTLMFIDEKKNRKYMEGLLSILNKYGSTCSVDDLAVHLGNLYYGSSKGEFKNYDEYWKSLLTDLKLPCDLHLVKELEKFWVKNYPTLFKLYDRVVPVLVGLQRKYKLVLVSNCSLGMLEVVGALGIDAFFEAIILSYQVGVRKPDKRIYFEALQKATLQAHECIFVADEISDLEGARMVGLRTLLVRQGSHTTHEATDPDFKPDFECNSISEITTIL
jgi:putative hydrolase of the HAD superfamily